MNHKHRFCGKFRGRSIASNKTTVRKDNKNGPKALAQDPLKVSEMCYSVLEPSELGELPLLDTESFYDRLTDSTHGS